jgi:hypothetical protein
MLKPTRTLAHRAYADFLMPSRLGRFEALLDGLRSSGYTVTSIEGVLEATSDPGEIGPKVAILRHDVDTDPKTARAMWEIEMRVGVIGSYFFRLSTFDRPLMVDMAASGFGVGYHYEEVATIAKQRRLRTREAALQSLPAAQALFEGNLRALRAATGIPLRVAASHGDFVNRRLGVANWVMLRDRQFRAQVGISAEAYDDDLMMPVSARFNDTLYPKYWTPEPPSRAIASASPVIYLLVHPRHWRVARMANATDDLRRVVEALRLFSPRRATM